MATVFTKDTPSQSEKTPRLTKLGDLLAEWADDAEAAHEAFTTGKPRGPVSGLKSLDRELGGALSPGKHLMHAGPGVGKTALALQIAATAGCPVLFISCEMGVLELFRRVTARVTGTYLGRLKTGEIAPSESLRLARSAATAAPNLIFADATRQYADPTWIRDAAQIARGDDRDVLIVVDSVHSWVDSAPGDLGEYDRIGAGLATLGTIAHALNCPVLAIAERNRASMKSGGMSAGAGSRKLEYSAESIWDLNVKEDAAPDVHGELPITLTLAKNRNGSPNKRVPLLFHGALQRFREA